MSEKLTPWFPGDVKPLRVGVYEKKVQRVGKFQYWNGGFWCGWSFSVESASERRNYKSDDQSSDWRGLADPPK